jgi:uncharacterized Tic20 family protein
MNTTPSTEDRIWSVISHLSSLAFGIGILLPIIGWSDQRRKSNYSSFQSLQALGYQSLGYTVWVLLSAIAAIIFVIIMLTALGVAERNGGNLNALPGIWMGIFVAFIFGLLGIYFLLPIIAAISCVFGKDFRYPIMGTRLAHYLDYDLTEKSEEYRGLNEDHEFHWVAAMGHFSILILLWGMLAPLTAWLLYGKRSRFLKLQSIQTLVYQAGTTILFFVALVMCLFGFLLLITGAEVIGQPNLNSSTGIFRILVFGVSLLISFLIILFIPLLHILAQWAGYRVLKGDDYRYPLLGRLVDRWIINKTPLVEDDDLSLEGKSS